MGYLIHAAEGCVVIINPCSDQEVNTGSSRTHTLGSSRGETLSDRN